MARTLKSDKLLFWATLLLVGASVVMVYSASAVQADTTYQKSYYILVRQLVWAALGIALLLGVMRVDYHKLKRPALIWALLKAGYTAFRTLAVPEDRGLALGFIAGTVGLLGHALGANTFIIVRIMEPFWFFAGIVMMLPLLERDALASRASPARR